MTTKIDSEAPPITTTNKGIVVSWKAALGIIGVLMVGSGSGNAVTSYLGIGGSRVSAEEFKSHERVQELGYKTMGDRVAVCENAIDLMAQTIDKVALVQRTQVATEEARRLTSSLKNAEQRETQFIRLFRLNIDRMGEKTPLPPCATLDCD